MNIFAIITATIGADFLTKEVVVDDRVVTMQVMFAKIGKQFSWKFRSLRFGIIFIQLSRNKFRYGILPDKSVSNR